MLHLLGLHKLRTGIRRARRSRYPHGRRTVSHQPRLRVRALTRMSRRVLPREAISRDTEFLPEDRLWQYAEAQITEPCPAPARSGAAMRLNARYAEPRKRTYPGRNIGDPLRRGDCLTATQRAAAMAMA